MTPRKLVGGFKLDQAIKSGIQRRKAVIRKMAILQLGLELVERGLPEAPLQGHPLTDINVLMIGDNCIEF